MPAREGGSYTADPDTGEETLVERTQPSTAEVPPEAAPDPIRSAELEPAGSAPPAAGPTRRRGGDSRAQE